MSEFQTGRRIGPQPSPAPRPSRQSALLLWVIAGAGLILMQPLSSPLARALAGLDPQLQALIYNLAYYLPFAALPALLLGRREGLWRAYRPYPLTILSALSIVALALLGVFLVTDLSALWAILLEALGLRLSPGGFLAPTNTAQLALCVLSVAVLPAVCEEFVFRGAILSAFERNGTRRAVFASALLFALLHGSLEGFPAQLLTGVILGWLVVYCDSIYAGLIYHTTHNAASILLQFALAREADAAAQTASGSTLELLGGAPALLQLALELLMMGAMALFTLRMFRAVARLRGVAIQPPRSERLRAPEWALLLTGLMLTAALFAEDLWLGALLGGAA